MGHFATGVTVVAARREDGAPCGLTANSVASVSLRPRLILVCLHREAATRRCILDSGAFAVSVLPVEQKVLARRFSVADRVGRFDDVPHRSEVTGSPVLENALAWIDCLVRDVHESGDHSIVVGEVVACDAREGDALVFYRGGYRSVGP